MQDIDPSGRHLAWYFSKSKYNKCLRRILMHTEPKPLANPKPNPKAKAQAKA